MNGSSLLPSSATNLQHALALVTAKATDLNHNTIRESRDPQTCTEALLPWLAWERSIDDAEGWLFAETEEAKRNLIADYIQKHELKGTPHSIRKLFRDLNLGEIDIIEHIGRLKYDGSKTRGGKYIHGGNETTWAMYSVVLKQRPITNDQADLLIQILKGIAPLRCKLHKIYYPRVAIRHNGKAARGGAYNYGTIDG